MSPNLERFLTDRDIDDEPELDEWAAADRARDLALDTEWGI